MPTTSEWHKYRLNPAQLKQYYQYGYVSNIPVLSSDQISLLLDDYSIILNAVNSDNATAISSWSSSIQSDRACPSLTNKDILSLLHEYHSNETGDDSNLLFHCLGHWRVTESFHDLIFHPAITVPTAQLLYIDQQRYACSNDQIVEFCDEVCVRFWHDQLFAKPPGCGGNVAWHQDYSYWTRTKPMQHMTVHIALDEQTEENGAICYVPGSHEWYRKDESNGEILPLPITDLHFVDMESIFGILTNEEKENWKVEVCELKPGEAVFHHPLSVHGSYPNKSDKARRAMALNYFKDGTYSATNEPLLDGMDVVPKGQYLQTRFNPIVYEPSYVRNGL